MPKIEKKHAQGFGIGYLYTLLVAMKNDLAAQKVIIDELVDDHATFKTNIDAVEILIEEIHDDHATLKTMLDDIKAKHENHRHSVAGASGVGTAPSTEATTAEATVSTINLTVK